VETSREVGKVSDKKIEQFWRDATADDVARVVKGEKIAIRYRESEDDKWSTEKLYLAGYDASDKDGCHWLSNKGDMLSECQVYDPPAWYINKPDPGEGYRLLEKFPPEELQGGDDWFSFGDKAWHTSFNILTNCSTQTYEVWYRRRIANNPASPNGCRSRDTIPSGWRVLGKDEERLASDAYWSLGCKEWIIIGDDLVKYANELSKWHAIRRLGSFDLVVGFNYILPNGQAIRITAKGFEVL
jgi:hypothetical protein